MDLALRLRFQATAPATMLTVLFPYQEDEPEPTIEIFSTGSPNSMGARIKTANSEDITICSLISGKYQNLLGCLDFTGEKLWLRTRAGKVSDALAIGASLIRYQDQQLLNDSVLLPQFIWGEKRSLTEER
jgi:hypothetical protein